MPRSVGIFDLLDSRAFGSIWLWVLLVLVWTMIGRRILGVPSDVIAAVGKAEAGPADDPAALALLDWLSLTLPRWQLAPPRDVILLGAGCFLLTTLAILGFGYRLEMAQALLLLILPFTALIPLELRLAQRLRALLVRAADGLPVNEAAADAARQMRRHQATVTALSLPTIMLVTIYAVLWRLAHSPVF